MIRLRQRARSKPGSRTKRQRQEEAARTARVRQQPAESSYHFAYPDLCQVNKMVTAMVAIFGLSWFPLNLINLTADLVESETGGLCKYRQSNVDKY